MRMTTDTLAAAHEALRTGAWAEARAGFDAAVEAAPSGEAFEGLGWAGYWLSDESLTFDARERAYRAYRAEGDAGGAGRVAAWLASDHLEFRGDDAVARGLARARPPAARRRRARRPRTTAGSRCTRARTR